MIGSQAEGMCLWFSCSGDLTVGFYYFVLFFAYLIFNSSHIYFNVLKEGKYLYSGFSFIPIVKYICSLI